MFWHISNVTLHLLQTVPLCVPVSLPFLANFWQNIKVLFRAFEAEKYTGLPKNVAITEGLPKCSE